MSDQTPKDHLAQIQEMTLAPLNDGVPALIKLASGEEIIGLLYDRPADSRHYYIERPVKIRSRVDLRQQHRRTTFEAWVTPLANESLIPVAAGLIILVATLKPTMLTSYSKWANQLYGPLTGVDGGTLAEQFQTHAQWTQFAHMPAENISGQVH